LYAFHLAFVSGARFYIGQKLYTAQISKCIDITMNYIYTVISTIINMFDFQMLLAKKKK